MDNDRTTQILHNILDCLKKQEAMKNLSREENVFNRRRNSFSQICAMYAVIAVFIATLGASFLTYMHDTFEDRPEGTPPKGTDDVVFIFLLFSILLSISSAIALGFGASPTLLLSIPTKNPIQELAILLIGAGVPRSIAYRLQRFAPGARESQSRVAQRELLSPKTATFNGSGQLRRRTWLTVKAKLMAVTCLNSMPKSKRLFSTESQFIVGMLLVAVFCIFLSLASLATAVITFSWAELNKSVAIFVTATLVFPFAVVSTVALIYRCTLFRFTHERKSFQETGNQGGIPQALDLMRGENHV
ncbi:hypothetical protein A7U60_g9047 [Sanghuangporus baumii]|uniref:Uncharacterized protein n=1 Tax=Sanghuangporus baumii TaxID=108892 RepID=A0A9Q5HQA2_SANBA|nr:hypothetical protein A7U60_g9047 [Sanghuangporus baumii]